MYLGGKGQIPEGENNLSLSCVQLFVTPQTVAHQAPLSMGFSRQEYWCGLPCPPPEDLPDLGIELMSLASPTLAGGSFTSNATWEAHTLYIFMYLFYLYYIWMFISMYQS